METAVTKFNTGKLKNSLQKQKRGDNMLVAKHRASTQITDVKRTDKSVVLRSKAEQIQFIPISGSTETERMRFLLER